MFSMCTTRCNLCATHLNNFQSKLYFLYPEQHFPLAQRTCAVSWWCKLPTQIDVLCRWTWSCGWLIHASISFLMPLLLVNDGEGRNRLYWWSYVIEKKLCGRRVTGYLTGAAQSLDRQHLRRSAVVRHPTSQQGRLVVICTNYGASAVRSVQYMVCTAGSHSGNSDGGCLWDVTPWCLVDNYDRFGETYSPLLMGNPTYWGGRLHRTVRSQLLC